MRKLAWVSAFALMWCSCAAAQGAIYYWVQDGISSYSDSPPSSEAAFGEHYVGPVYEVEAEADAPITDDDQSDARYAEMEAQQQAQVEEHAQHRADLAQAELSIAAAKIRMAQTARASIPHTSFGGSTGIADQGNRQAQDQAARQQQKFLDQNNAADLQLEQNLNPDVSTNPDNWDAPIGGEAAQSQQIQDENNAGN